MTLHATIDRVTDRIRKRSAESRTAYLAKIARLAEDGPRRAHLSCGNQAHAYAAMPDKDDLATTRKQLEALRASGVNMLFPDYPQPYWFYDLCDELGLYVIDCANINAPEKRDDRKVGGTPSNDPSLADEYLERVKAMYYRSRNHSCVIAFALGGESGNGYNMYKAYEWLKSVEKSRPVICADADGEWNSDL